MKKIVSISLIVSLALNPLFVSVNANESESIFASNKQESQKEVLQIIL